MDPAQAAALIQAQAICAYAEICAMLSEDIAWRAEGKNPHSPEAYRQVAARFGIGHNQVLETFQAANRS